MSNKSPFYIVEEFLSPLLCEEIIDILDYNIPDADKDGFDVKTTKTSERAEAIVYERLLLTLPELQAYYQFAYKGTERIAFEWFPEGSQGQFICENSEYMRKKWLRTKNRDFTGIIFMCDYQETIPFEKDFEVYGGKLEFVQHRFGFNPQRGTMVVFPSDPHFINITTEVFAGELFQARLQIAAQKPFIYQPTMFPGNYTTWFSSPQK